MTEGQPSRPSNLDNIIAINQGKKPYSWELPAIPALSPKEILDKFEQGFIILDARPPYAFGAAHIPYAYNIQLDNSEFEQRVGWVIPNDSKLLLITEYPEQIDFAIKKLAFVGIASNVAGYLVGGMDAWIKAGFTHSVVPQISVHELQKEIRSHDIKILDVREAKEWDNGHIQNAFHISYKKLENEIPNGMPFDPNEKIAVICGGGFRSSTGTSILKRNGYLQVLNVTGGMSAWVSSGYPVESLEGCTIN